MVRKIAFIFPGQGSQVVGMGKELSETNSDVKSFFDRADQRLGINLSEVIFEGPQETLTQTTNAQPALLTTCMSIHHELIKAGINPDYTAGHSLGEYSALVASGAISFEDAVFTVRKRGEFMEEAVPSGEGTMAAILGMDRQQLKEITDSVTSEGNSVQLANLNCPGQIVISGTAKGVELASIKAKDEGAKKVIPLQVSGPFHSELMKPAADKLYGVLESITISDANIPVIANVTANEVTSEKDIKRLLIEQIYSPVLWEDTVERLLELGVDTFIEIGPGKVLSGLVKKVNRRVTTLNVSDQASLQEVIEKLKEVEA